MRQVQFPKIVLTVSGQAGEPCPECGVKKIVEVPQTAQTLLLQALLTCFDEHGQRVSPTMEDLEERIPLRKRIAEAKASILLEQSEWELLCKVIGKPYRWPWTHEDVLKVCHAVIEAEERDVEVKPNRAQRRGAKVTGGNNGR